MHKRLINGLIYAGVAIVTAIATIAIRANDKPHIIVLDIAPTWHDEIVLGETAPETVPEIVPEKETETIIETTTEIPILDSVPFEPELQEWIYTYSCDRGISPYLVYAVCWRESRYNIDIAGDNGESHGLMQIKAKYHTERLNRLGVSDLYDPKQNIKVGVDYLVELLNYREDATLEWVLMAYNGGPTYADEMQKNGKVSGYALEVISKMNELYLEGES